MRFSEASGRKVVSTTTAESVGKIDDFVVDVKGPAVVAVAVKKADSGDTLRWTDITAFGADAVTVESAERITSVGDDIAPLLEKRNHVLKKLVLSTAGDALGKVADVEFDAMTGQIVALVLDSGEIAASRMIGIGSYAVVVQAE